MTRNLIAGAMILFGWATTAALVWPAAAGATTLYGLVSTGELFSSSNHGTTWLPHATLPLRDAVDLHARSTSQELFLAGQSGEVYRSTDAGLSWSARGGVSASEVADFLIDQAGNLLLLTQTGSFHRSTDLGETFEPVAALPGSAFEALATCSTGELCVLTRTGEIYASGDQGATWGIRSLLAISDAVDMVSSTSGLYVLTDPGEIMRSTDAGFSWSLTGTLSQVGMRALTSDGALLAAATREGHVATSPDGMVWTWQGSINQLSLTTLAVDTPVASAAAGQPLARAFLSLETPRPNPSTAGGATLMLRLSEEDDVDLVLYDGAGRGVARYGRQRLPAGSHALFWKPPIRAAGVYFVRLVTGAHGCRQQQWIVIP